MKIQSVNSLTQINHTGDKKKENGKYKSNIGKVIGFTVGATLGTTFVVTQIKSLKNPRGKRNIIEGLNAKYKCLNDVEKRVPELDEFGKVIQPKDGVSARTKKVVANFKRDLVLWAGVMTGATTWIGSRADKSISQVKKEEALLKKNL